MAESYDAEKHAAAMVTTLPCLGPGRWNVVLRDPADHDEFVVVAHDEHRTDAANIAGSVEGILAVQLREAHAAGLAEGEADGLASARPWLEQIQRLAREAHDRDTLSWSTIECVDGVATRALRELATAAGEGRE